MKCPRDGGELQPAVRYNIQVDVCPTCNGMWLDHDELDQLEDTVFADDPNKGTMMLESQITQGHCPKCDALLEQFTYRYHLSIQLDQCPNGHGYWLDAGEDAKILDVMRERAPDLERKADAEGDFQGFMNKVWRSVKFK
ncbi:MAG: zf-TFIIB domain-containing protein [Anaerolineae bacterium]